MKKLIMALTLAFLFASCDSENAETSNLNFSTENSQMVSKSNISSGLQKLREEAFRDKNTGRVIEFNSEKGIIFTTGKFNTRIVIPPKSITRKGGVAINEPIKIDFVEIYEKGGMLVMNTPTMAEARPGSSDKTLLITGGEFYINITTARDNEPVEIVSPIKVEINPNNSAATPDDMLLWNGERDNNDNLTWVEAPKNELEFENGQPVSKNGYSVLINSSSNFGWCNIDKFYRPGAPMTKIGVKVPIGFDDSNSSVYVAIKGENNMLAQVYLYNPSNNMFGVTNDCLPAGYEIHVIFVGETNGQYVYHIDTVTLTINGSYDFSNINLTTATSYSQVEQIISQLP